MERRFSLAVRLSAMISLLIVVLLGAVIAMIGINLQRSVAALVSEENKQIAEARAAEIGKLLDSYRWQLTVLSAQDFLTRGDKGAAEDLMLKEMIKHVSQDVGTVLVVWSDGSAKTAAGGYVNVAERGYFKAVFGEKKDYVIGDVAISKATNLPAVIIAKAIRAPGGETRGIAAFEIKMETLSGIAASIKLGSTGYGWIIDQRGLVIAHPTKEAVLALDVTNADKDGYKGLDALGKRMLSSEKGQGDYVRKDGVEMMTFFARVPNSPGWVLGLSVERREVFATVTELLGLLLAILVVGIALSILVAVFIARSIARPVSFTAATMRMMAEGDLRARATISPTAAGWRSAATR